MGPLLFNIFLADLFLTFSNKEIANYADDTTSYAASGNIDDLIASLKKSNDLLKWFDDIFVKVILRSTIYPLVLAERLKWKKLTSK